MNNVCIAHHLVEENICHWYNIIMIIDWLFCFIQNVKKNTFDFFVCVFNHVLYATFNRFSIPVLYFFVAVFIFFSNFTQKSNYFLKKTERNEWLIWINFHLLRFCFNEEIKLVSLELQWNNCDGNSFSMAVYQHDGDYDGCSCCCDCTLIWLYCLEMSLINLKYNSPSSYFSKQKLFWWYIHYDLFVIWYMKYANEFQTKFMFDNF